MNVELSAVGQARLVIPSVYRTEYILSLRRASTHRGDVRALARVLAYAWRWTSAMPWSERAAAEGRLHATNALVDATDAPDRGVRLELPCENASRWRDGGPRPQDRDDATSSARAMSRARMAVLSAARSTVAKRILRPRGLGGDRTHDQGIMSPLL